MYRVAISALFASSLLVPAFAGAQTTIDITVPGGQICSYSTGTVAASPTPGHLTATATSFTGTGCGSTSNGNAPVTFGPASPLSPATGQLGNTGGSQSFTFQALNASQCSGTITPSAGTNFTSTFCSTAVGCQGSQTVTASFPANSTGNDIKYTVGVSCTGPGSTTAVASPVSPQVTVSAGSVTGCINAPTIPGPNSTTWTQLTTPVTANYFSLGNKTVNPTQFSSIFTSPGISPDLVWPSSYDAVPVIPLSTSKYIAAAFTSTSPYLTNSASNTYGNIDINSSSFTAAISMTISTACGDFGQISPTTIVPGCTKNKAIAGNIALEWTKSGSCKLQDGKPYYLNIISADISQLPTGGVATSTANSTCTNSSCTVPLQNGPGNWSH
jgi:hypothetical protein